MKTEKDKYLRKRALFLERIQQITPSISQTQLIGRPRLSIRVNTLKSDQTFADSIAWAPHCFWGTGDQRALTHGADFAEGRIYLQNAASFIPPLVLQPQAGERILDMCAAPGGKASHIAALSNNQAELWVNDNSRPRLLRMQANFARLGVKPAHTTLFAIARLAKELPQDYFDKILLDAPCSGEGMLDIDNPKDFTYWSVAQIKRLQSLQKQAIRIAWQLLKPGGHLVYSTCTMAPEENEAVVDYLLRQQDDAELLPITLAFPNSIPSVQAWNGKTFTKAVVSCLRLAPSETIEAFFVAHLHKKAI